MKVAGDLDSLIGKSHIEIEKKKKLALQCGGGSKGKGTGIECKGHIEGHFGIITHSHT